MIPARAGGCGRWPWTLLLAAVLLAGSPALEAHRLRLFAFADDGRIEGSAYFAGGDPAAGARIVLESADGEVLAERVADAEGRFSFPVAGGLDHHILADSRDGHQARWTVSAAEAAPGASHAGGPGTSPPADAAAGAGPESGSELAVLVERAVARQLRPLREELLACQEQTRFRDVLGGLGYILGLAGVAAWWRGRRPGGEP